MKTNMTNDTLTVDKKAGELTLNFHGVHKEPIKFQTSMKRIGKLQTKLAYSDGKRMFSISDKESQSVEFSIPEDMDAATLTADIKEAVNLFGGAGFGWREGKLMLTQVGSLLAKHLPVPSTTQSLIVSF